MSDEQKPEPAVYVVLTLGDRTLARVKDALEDDNLCEVADSARLLRLEELRPLLVRYLCTGDGSCSGKCTEKCSAWLDYVGGADAALAAIKEKLAK